LAGQWIFEEEVGGKLLAYQKRILQLTMYKRRLLNIGGDQGLAFGMEGWSAQSHQDKAPSMSEDNRRLSKWKPQYHSCPRLLYEPTKVST
jgi:hypothetical protein